MIVTKNPLPKKQIGLEKIDKKTLTVYSVLKKTGGLSQLVHDNGQWRWVNLTRSNIKSTSASENFQEALKCRYNQRSSYVVAAFDKKMPLSKVHTILEGIAKLPSSNPPSTKNLNKATQKPLTKIKKTNIVN